MKRIFTFIIALISIAAVLVSCDPYWNHHEWRCGWCGAINDWDNNYCWNCGEPF